MPSQIFAVHAIDTDAHAMNSSPVRCEMVKFLRDCCEHSSGNAIASNAHRRDVAPVNVKGSKAMASRKPKITVSLVVPVVQAYQPPKHS